MRLKPKQIWFHEDLVGKIDKILYVVEPSWRGNAAWCRTKNSHGLIKDENYSPQELIDNRYWHLTSPKQVFDALLKYCFNVDVKAKPQHYFEVLFSDGSPSECIENAIDWNDTKDALHVYNENGDAIAMFYKNNIRGIVDRSEEKDEV